MITELSIEEMESCRHRVNTLLQPLQTYAAPQDYSLQFQALMELNQRFASLYLLFDETYLKVTALEKKLLPFL